MSGPTPVPPMRLLLRLQEFYLLRLSFPALFGSHNLVNVGGPQPRIVNNPVWPLSLSLAATQKIDFSFSSWGYLDVSVRPVPFSCSWAWMAVHHHSRIAPFGCLRVADYLHLSAAFRSLSRPSSAPSAKASTRCSLYLTISLLSKCSLA